VIELDRWAMVRVTEARLARTRDPRHRRNLGLLIDHMRAEIAADVDALLATVSPDVAYRTHGAGPELQPVGREAVADFYRERASAGHLYFEFAIEYLAVDDDVLVTDGVMTSLIPARSMPAVAADDGTVYKLVTRMSISWPIAVDGLLAGEHSHSTVLSFEPVAAQELPSDYETATATA